MATLSSLEVIARKITIERYNATKNQVNLIDILKQDLLNEITEKFTLDEILKEYGDAEFIIGTVNRVFKNQTSRSVKNEKKRDEIAVNE